MNSFTCLGVDIAFCKLPLLAFAISTVPEEMNTYLVWSSSPWLCQDTALGAVSSGKRRACVSCPYGNHHYGVRFALLSAMTSSFNKQDCHCATHNNNNNKEALGFFFESHQVPSQSFNVATGVSYGKGASR